MENTKSKRDPLNKLREIIREEVRKAIKLEMVPLLLEIIKSVNVKTLVESKTLPYGKTTTPGVSTTTSTPYVETLKPKNTVSALLEETKREMMQKAGFDVADFGIRDSGAPILQERVDNLLEETKKEMVQKAESKVTSNSDIDMMLRTARKGSAEEFVEINQVPDYTNMMQKMTSK